MTIEETRKLGIEFERRVQTMIPDTELLDKLDTETIYSFLNQYQDKYVHDIFRSLDQITAGTKLQAHIDSVLQSLLHTKTIFITDKGVEDHTEPATDEYGNVIIDTARSVSYPLPKSFYMYLRSVSNVGKTFSFKGKNDGSKSPIRILPNQLISQNDLWRLLETPHDSLRILRYPAAVLTQPRDIGKEGVVPTLTVIYDQYTEPLGIKVTYYKEPDHFSLMTSTKCELPMDAFEELVSGAVDLYVQYVAGAEARKRQLDEARRQAAKEQEANNARRGRNDE